MKNKQLTTSGFKQFVARTTLVTAAVVMVISTPMSVRAESLQDQINRKTAEINAFNAEAARLRGEANTLQNAVNALSAQKNAIQAELDLNQAKYDQLVAEITANEKKLADQQKVMASAISDLASEDGTSPIEVLAGSRSIGDYIDQQEYRSSIRDQLETSIGQIKVLKAALTKQKVEVEQVLNDQKSRRDALAAKEAEQAQLLANTRGEEAAYQGLVNSRQAELEQLYSQQRASLSRAGGQIIPGDPGRGGYPSDLANAPKDSVVDPWGMYNRECVSYTAWKVHQKNGHMPYWGGRGNANEWPGNADAEGIARGAAPRVGSVAIIYSVYAGDIYGHAAWVESIEGGDVIVSQYNWGSPGSYTKMRVSASFFDTYIYF